MAIQTGDTDLMRAVVLLAAGVVAVPLFRRLGLGSVLGYLAAGLVIGPFGFGFFTDPRAILHVAELGVVMFLFIIGLEMQPSHLWSLRREIFGVGALQIGVCMAALTAVGLLLGLSPDGAFIGAAGFVLTSTAIVMQILSERGDSALPRGQKIVSILLFEDLLIVPLLAVVALMAPVHDGSQAVSAGTRWVNLGIGFGSLAALVAAGIWLLNPLFRILAAAKAREVMTAAALLVVLGAALLMEMGGLSMAMGAFIAGVLLSESTFRHQLEADVEPFRGILLGLFFLSVGMSLNLSVVAANWRLIATGVLALMAAKALGVYAIARALRSSHAEALDRAVLMAQGGEFAFVLFSSAAAAGVIDATASANLTAMVVLSMALTPLAMIAVRSLTPKTEQSLEGVDVADGLDGTILTIGFGRFGQVMSQCLLARGCDVTIIDSDVDMIKSAAEFGFKIYYGDGRHLDVLRASGADKAQVIAVCVDDRDAADRIVEIARQAFPRAKLLVRAYDRPHAHKLVDAGVDFQIRETFESALYFGKATLLALGIDEGAVAETVAEVRRRDRARFDLEAVAGDNRAGRDLIIGNVTKPVPLTAPQRPSRALNEEAAVIAAGKPPA